MASLELEARLDNLLSTGQRETADSDIFAPIPEREECPICLIPLPLVECEISFYACCGKSICRGCTWKHMLSDMKSGISHRDQKCSLCRQPPIKDSINLVMPRHLRRLRSITERAK